MGARRRLKLGHWVFASAVTFALSTSACHRASTDVAPQDHDASPSLPVDRLAPGELPEGPETAFDLRLPRGLSVTRTFSGIVHATSTTLAPDQVVGYFRSHVTGGAVVTRTDQTRFEGAHPPNGQRQLTIEIRAGENGVSTCDVLLIDTTPPPVAPNLTDDERRAKAGFRPDGKLLDPSRLE